MELIKWVFSAVVGITMAIFAVVVTISALVFATVMKLLGLVIVIAGVLAVLFKEAIDSRDHK